MEYKEKAMNKERERRVKEKKSKEGKLKEMKHRIKERKQKNGLSEMFCR